MRVGTSVRVEAAMPLHGFLSRLAVAAALLCLGRADAHGCSFPMGTRWDDPLLLSPDGGPLYPNTKGDVNVEEGARIFVTCPGEGNSVMVREDPGSGGADGSGVAESDEDKRENDGDGGKGGVDGGRSGKDQRVGVSGGDGDEGNSDNGSGNGNEGGGSEVTKIQGGFVADSGARRNEGRNKTGVGSESIAKDGENKDLSGGGASNEDSESSRTEGNIDTGNSKYRTDTTYRFHGIRIQTMGISSGGEGCKGSAAGKYECGKSRGQGLGSVGNGEEDIDISDPELMAMCVTGRNFSIGQRVVNITNVKCRKSPMYTFKSTGATASEATEIKGPSCGGPRPAQLFQIGFLTSMEFLEMIDICFDIDTLTPVYTKHYVPREIKGRRSSKGQTWFRVGPKFRGLNPTKYYKGQRASLKGLNIPDIPGQFLNRGHSSPRGDFIQVAQQRATYLYENTAPQWASFNAGDWEKLERSTRNLAAARRNLTVITGTYGTASLKDTSNNDVHIHLSRGRGHKNLTVPAVFWKVVLDPDSLEGIAVLGANKPKNYESSLPPWPCEDNLCPEVEWLQRRGQLYCCAVADLQRELQLPVLRNLRQLQPLTKLTSPNKSSVKYSANFRGQA